MNSFVSGFFILQKTKPN